MHKDNAQHTKQTNTCSLPRKLFSSRSTGGRRLFLLYCNRESTRSNYGMAIFPKQFRKLYEKRLHSPRRRVKFHLLINSFEKCSLKRKNRRRPYGLACNICQFDNTFLALSFCCFCTFMPQCLEN